MSTLTVDLIAFDLVARGGLEPPNPHYDLNFFLIHALLAPDFKNCSLLIASRFIP